jgi:hypothetical protein
MTDVGVGMIGILGRHGLWSVVVNVAIVSVDRLRGEGSGGGQHEPEH